MDEDELLGRFSWSAEGILLVRDGKYPQDPSRPATVIETELYLLVTGEGGAVKGLTPTEVVVDEAATIRQDQIPSWAERWKA